MGEHALGDLDAQTLKMATGFSGGIGNTRRDMCGALSAGIMVIGALHGRTRPEEDDTLCLKLTTGYRDRFARELGSVNCSELRAGRYGSQGEEPCSVLVERAARLLLAVLDGDENEDGKPG